MNEQKKHLSVSILTLLGILLLISVIFLAPYLKNQGNRTHLFLYAVTGSICHQVPERCFYLWTHPLAVCSRCLGIYAGFLIGTLLYPLLHGFSHTRLPQIEIMLLMSIPIGIDAFANLIHIWNSPGWIRFGVGLFWGTLLPYFFIPGMVDALRLPRRRG